MNTAGWSARCARRFEHFLPELFRKVTRRYDGEDIDLDQLVDLVVDLTDRRHAVGKNLLAARTHSARRCRRPVARHERDD